LEAEGESFTIFGRSLLDLYIALARLDSLQLYTFSNQKKQRGMGDFTLKIDVLSKLRTGLSTATPGAGQKMPGLRREIQRISLATFGHPQ
jgi:hypothetical protein